MPGYCCVDGCNSRQEMGRSFFRCPKDKTRCENWKRALGFMGTHKYASLTPEQCNDRIKICNLHFPEGSYMKHNLKAYLLHNAVPSLNLLKSSDFKDHKNASLQTDDVKSYKDVSVQTDDVSDGVKCYEDVSLQTYVFIRDKSTQTLVALSANIPRKQKLKEEIKTLKRAATPSATPSTEPSPKKRKCQRQLETGITTEDIHKYLEKNYSEQHSKLLKTQLNLLKKSPKGCRYTDEFKKFALSVYFLGPNAYKQFSTFYKLPSKSTLNRFTRKWKIDPGFNDFIFRLLELRAKILKEKEKDCIICLDEIALKSHFYYDISKDKIVSFEEAHNPNSTKVATTALVVMMRGIASNWKQPIAYFFYNSASPSEEIKEMLFESVKRLTAIGFNVTGVVSDHIYKTCLYF